MGGVEMKYIYNRSQYINFIVRASEQKGTECHEEAYFVDHLLTTLVKENLSRISSGGFTILSFEEDEGVTSLEFFYDEGFGEIDYIELSRDSLLELHGH